MAFDSIPYYDPHWQDIPLASNLDTLKVGEPLQRQFVLNNSGSEFPIVGSGIAPMLQAGVPLYGITESPIVMMQKSALGAAMQILTRGDPNVPNYYWAIDTYQNLQHLLTPAWKNNPPAV